MALLTHTLRVRLTEEEAAWISEMATEASTTDSQMARQLILSCRELRPETKLVLGELLLFKHSLYELLEVPENVRDQAEHNAYAIRDELIQESLEAFNGENTENNAIDTSAAAIP